MYPKRTDLKFLSVPTKRALKAGSKPMRAIAEELAVSVGSVHGMLKAPAAAA